MGDASPYERDGLRKQRDLWLVGFKRAVLLLTYEKNSQERFGYLGVFFYPFWALRSAPGVTNC